MIITIEEYAETPVINKSVIPDIEFPSYAVEADRLIRSFVIRPVPGEYRDCYVPTAALLCSQLFKDHNPANPQGLKSVSESSGRGDYSYSQTFAEALPEAERLAVYYRIVREGLMYCNQQFTGLFYTGLKC